MKTASQILDAAFLTAYNNASLTNAQVMGVLDCDWTAVGVKLRSERLALHTTMKRVGGAKGTSEVIRDRDLAWEAKFWKVDGTIQEKPNGSYVPLKTRFSNSELQAKLEQAIASTSSAAPVADAPAAPAADAPAAAAPADAAVATAPADAAVATAPAADAPAATAPADAAVATAPAAVATAPAATPEPEPVTFNAELLNETYEFSGPDITTAVEALMAKMRELNFSKVQCTDKRTNRIVGLGDIADGGSYKFAKQLTAN